MFQSIILMTLSTAMSYADAPSSVLQIWYVPRCSRELKKAVLSFDSGLRSAGTSERACLRTCSVCAPAAGTLPRPAALSRKHHPRKISSAPYPHRELESDH